MDLIPYAERVEWPFAEVTHPTAIAIDDARGLVAIAWTDPEVVPDQPLYRAAVYELATHTCLARFEHAHWPINDVAFHPHRSELAIATGEYDGGYFFEGQLWIWNWTTERWHSELLESREVLRVAYRDAGASLAVVVSPSTHTDRRGAHAFVVATTAAGAGRGYLHGEQGEPDPRFVSELTRYAIGLGDDGRAAFEQAKRRIGLVQHPMICDLAWLGDGGLALAHVNGTLGLWQTGTGAYQTVAPPRDGLELDRLHTLPSGQLLVCGVRSTGHNAWESSLYELAGTTLRERRTFDRYYSISMDLYGRILARDTAPRVRGGPPGRDIILGPDGSELHVEDLGHYEAPSHALRIDGASALYFLRGEPTKPHLNKQLCTIDDHVRVAYVWDDPGPHYLCNSAVVIDDAILVRSFVVYSVHGLHNVVIERIDLATGELVWREAFTAIAVKLVHWRAAGCVVASLADRSIVAIDVASGRKTHHAAFTIGGGETLVTAIAVHDEAIAFGTIDGRVSISAWR